MDFLKQVKENHSNLNSQNKKISDYLVMLRNKKELTSKEIDDQVLLRAELHSIQRKRRAVPKEPFDKKLQLEKLREIWKYHDDSVAKLIVGLYLFIPALRSDYKKSEYQDGTISLRTIKCKPRDIQIIVPEILIELCENFYDRLPKHDYFIKYVQRSSTKLFQNDLGINDYRKIWAEFGHRTMTAPDIEELAFNMNHSLAIHNSEYMPNMIIEYKPET